MRCLPRGGAYGLSPPWSVTSVDFRQPEGAIHFEVDCMAKRLPCPSCGAADQPIHDRIARRWQHLHFFQFRAFIDARLPRVACSACSKATQVEVSWARPGSRFSLVMEAFVVAMCQAMPVAHVARLVGVSDDRIWRVLKHHVDQARAKEDHAAVRRIGVDETSTRRGKGSRWALLKNSVNWTRKQIDTMHWLQRSGLKTARAWRLKEALCRIYQQCTDPAEAERLLRRWISWARRSRLTPFKVLSATVRAHLEGIVEHFRSGLSNGFVEGMNSQIQAAKARAKGYATTANMTVIAYLLCAKLRHLPRNPWLPHHAS